MKTILTLLTVATLSVSLLAADMETYEPDKPSGTHTDYITGPNGRRRITVSNFGTEDASVAHMLGSPAEAGRHESRSGRSRNLEGGLGTISE